MNKKKKEIIEYIVLIVVILLIRTYLFVPIMVSGNSMVPTLNNGDVMILNKFNYLVNDIKRFDIVVVDYENEYIIKRVIGLPGDYVEYKNDILYVNGKKIEEVYDREYTEDFNLNDLNIEKIPNNYYLVLGDNRPISKDSRKIGLIDKKNIKGSTNFILFPFSRFGNVI